MSAIDIFLTAVYVLEVVGVVTVVVWIGVTLGRFIADSSGDDE